MLHDALCATCRMPHAIFRICISAFSVQLSAKRAKWEVGNKGSPDFQFPTSAPASSLITHHSSLALFCRSKDQCDRVGQLLPVLHFGLQLLPALGGERVKFCF